jgi:hypothetical protein
MKSNTPGFGVALGGLAAISSHAWNAVIYLDDLQGQLNTWL